MLNVCLLMPFACGALARDRRHASWCLSATGRGDMLRASSTHRTGAGKKAATTGLTEAPSRQSITLAATNLITVKEANRYVYGNDVELRDAVDKIRKVCDLPDGRLSTFREHDCPSTGSAIDS